jgi:hypothetical protein
MESIFGKEQFRKIFRDCQIKLSKYRDKVTKCENIEQYNDALKQNTDSDELRTQLDICFEKFTENREIVPRTKKPYQHNIKNYKKYLIGKIDFGLNDISYNNEILEKYKFLNDIFNLILPKPSEPVKEHQVSTIQG